MLLLDNVPLAPMTTLGVGGPAAYFCAAETEEDIREAAIFARERDLPIFVMGGGSNLVVSDAGFAGLALKIALIGITERSLGIAHIAFTVGAGEGWDAFVALTVQSGCAGLECLSGIPGTVGGTPIQNVGAYGQEISETTTEVQALHLGSLEAVTFSNADCQFSYRGSRFNSTDRGEYVITSVTFSLQPGGKPTIRYAELERHFAGRPEPTLSETREAVLAIRLRKAMVLAPGLEDSRSVGSFFKNPVISEEQYCELFERLTARGLSLPSYPAGEGQRKIPAAWLVEQAGFHKGFTKGAAGISRHHALAIVNRGGATAAEILALKDEIQARVHGEFGIELRPEPVFVGF